MRAESSVAMSAEEGNDRMGTWQVKLLDRDGDWLGIEWGVDSRAERLNEDWSWLKRPTSTRVGGWEVETWNAEIG